MNKSEPPKMSKSLNTRKKIKSPSGNSRASKNRKIRRDALREELKGREYIRQLSKIEQRLDPEHKETYNLKDMPKIRERSNILFKLLEKCLPSLRPTDVPVILEAKDSLQATGEGIIKSMTNGTLSPQEASSLMSAITAHLRVVEAEDLMQRIEELERKNL